MDYLLQTTVRKPLHSIITLTSSGRRHHTIITQLLYSHFRVVEIQTAEDLQFSERAMS
jgi:hypothetical protein